MVLKAEQQRIKTLLRDTITLLCKNGLAFKKEFSIEALIGVTLDQDDVLLVSINEKVQTEVEPPPAISASNDVDQSASDTEENHIDQKRMLSSRLPGPSSARKRPHAVLKREPPDAGGGERPEGQDGDVWGQSGPPMLSLDSALDDSSFHSSEQNHDEPATKRRPPSQDDDNCDEDDDEDSKDVIVIKEEMDREEWSRSSCSQQTGPGRPYRSGDTSGIPSSDVGEAAYSAQGDRDLAAVLQSGSLVPVGLQQAGLTMWSEGQQGPPGSRTSTVTSEGGPGSGDNQQMGGLGSSQMDLEAFRKDDGYCCPICGKAITSKWGLQVHLNWHKGIFRYQCVLCSKGFMSNSRLKGHMAQHAGEARFRCPICDRGFLYKDTLNSHMGVHQTDTVPRAANSNSGIEDSQE